MIVIALFCVLPVLRFLKFRIVSSAQGEPYATYQYPLLDLFSVMTAAAIALVAFRMSEGSPPSYLNNVRYLVYLGGLGVCFAVTSLLALAAVLGRHYWRWLVITVLFAPIGYLPATAVTDMTFFGPWWTAALTASHTLFVATLLLIFRFAGFRLVKIDDVPDSKTPYENSGDAGIAEVAT